MRNVGLAMQKIVELQCRRNRCTCSRPDNRSDDLSNGCLARKVEGVAQDERKVFVETRRNICGSEGVSPRGKVIMNVCAVGA